MERPLTLHSGCATPSLSRAGLCLLCTPLLACRSPGPARPALSHAVCDLTEGFQSRSKALCWVSPFGKAHKLPELGL